LSEETELAPAAPADEAQPAPKRGRTFRKSRPPMLQAAAARQARIASLAWTTLGNRERVMEFLNADHAELGARPLDLAIASDAGLARVEHVLLAMADAPRSEG